MHNDSIYADDGVFSTTNWETSVDHGNEDLIIPSIKNSQMNNSKYLM